MLQSGEREIAGLSCSSSLAPSGGKKIVSCRRTDCAGRIGDPMSEDSSDGKEFIRDEAEIKRQMFYQSRECSRNKDVDGVVEHSSRVIGDQPTDMLLRKITLIMGRLKEGEAERNYKDIQILWEASRYVPNPSIRQEVAECLYKSKFVELFVKIWRSVHQVAFFLKENNAHWKKLKKSMSVLWNICDVHPGICKDVCALGLIPCMLDSLSSVIYLDYYGDGRKEYFIKAVLGILHNVVRHHSEGRIVLRETGGVSSLQLLLESPSLMISAKTLIILSYIINESENEMLHSSNNVLAFVVEIFRDALRARNHFSAKYGMCVGEVLQGLNNLCICDANKTRLVKNGILPLYVQLLGADISREEQLFLVVRGIWTLAFSKTNKELIRQEPKCVDELLHLVEAGNETLRHAARGALWEIKDGISVPGLPQSTEFANVPHIMISYQWDVQPVMCKVKDTLKAAGFKIWMDVEHMRGSTLEAMALAVERASVVLICMSQSYKDSPSCRTESEYVYRLRKDIIPLLVQNNYIADGWLGMLVGTRLYFDFSNEENFDSQMSRLIKELGQRGKLEESSQDIIDFSDTLETSPNLWPVEKVKAWLEKVGLKHLQEKFEDISGDLLMELRQVQIRAPEFFYQTLQTDFSLKLSDILRFSRVLSTFSDFR